MSSARERGIVLVVVLSFILLFVIAVTSFMAINTSEIKVIRRQNDSTRAFYLAEGGFEQARYDLGQDADWTDDVINGFSCILTDLDSDNFYLLDYDSSTKTSLGGEFTVRLKNVAGSDNEIWIKSIGTYNDITRIVQAKVRRIGNPDEVTAAIEIEGTLDIRGNVDITGDVIQEASVSFSDVFGVDKITMEGIAQDYYSDTYYETAFDNDVADMNGGPTVTWVSAVGTESQISQNGWTGSGILIVEGNLKITGGVYNGVIWVTGALDISGNPVLNGGIFVEGGVAVDTEITGTAEITYDTVAIGDAFDQLASSPIIEFWQEVFE
ncbi:hypothetical protein ACFL5C_02900 [Candidatus Omnitrophota bacterium]